MKKLTLILSLIFVVACSTNDTGSVSSGKLYYDNLKKINISKAFMEIDVEEAKSRSKNSVAYLLQKDATDIVSEVLSRKLNAVGSDGMLRAVVTKADVYLSDQVVESSTIFEADQEVYITEIEIKFKLFNGIELLPRKQNHVYSRKITGLRKGANADEMQAFLDDISRSIIESTNIMVDQAARENFPEIVLKK